MRTIELAWPTAGAPVTRWEGAFARDEQVSFYFTTPATFAPQHSGQIVLVEFNGPPCPREGALSTSPTDFSVGIGGMGVFAGDEEVNIFYRFSEPTGRHASPEIVLLPSTTYYFNVQNVIDEQQAGVTEFGTLVMLEAI